MNCDRLARWYRLLEYLVFGRALERRRFEYLDQLAGVRNALLLGDGDGRFTAEFVKRYPLARVDSVELSSGMLALAQTRLRGFENVRFWAADARTIDLPRQYDLIATHFFLDCFLVDELQPLVARIAAHCPRGGWWLVSEFGLPDAGLRRVAARALIWIMYLFFWITTGLKVRRLPEYRPVLEESGFRIRRRRLTAGGLLVSELWERMAERRAR